MTQFLKPENATLSFESMTNKNGKYKSSAKLFSSTYKRILEFSYFFLIH